MEGPFEGRLAVLDTKAQVVMADAHDREEGIVPNLWCGILVAGPSKLTAIS